MENLGSFDVAVIGAGVVGSSAAYFAASLGAKVALIEQSLPGTEGSGRNAGGIRQQGRLPSELPLAMHSIRLWQRMRDELGGEFEYVQNGNLYLGFSEREVEILKAAAARQRRAGLHVQFLSPADVRTLAPGVTDRVLAANYCPSDGHANPILATRFLARLASQAGVHMQMGTRVLNLEVRGDRVTGLITEKGRLECPAVIAASGAWTAALGRRIGLNIPLLPRRTQILVTTPLPHFLRQFVSGNTVYVRQSRSGNLHIGGGGSWEELGFGKENSFHSLHRFVARATDVVPAVARTSVLRSWAGTLDISPDGGPLVGKIPGVDGLIVAVGYSGHGFAMGPGSGDVTARLALGMDPGVEIAGLDPARLPSDLDFQSQYVQNPEPAC